MKNGVVDHTKILFFPFYVIERMLLSTPASQNLFPAVDKILDDRLRMKGLIAPQRLIVGVPRSLHLKSQLLLLFLMNVSDHLQRIPMIHLVGLRNHHLLTALAVVLVLLVCYQGIARFVVASLVAQATVLAPCSSVLPHQKHHFFQECVCPSNSFSCVG